MIRLLLPLLLTLVSSVATAETLLPAAVAPKAVAAPVTDGLEEPRDIAFAPGDRNHLYIAEMGGLIRVVEGTTLQDDDLLDIQDLVAPSSGSGLESIAIPAGFASSRTFFISYSDKNGDSLIASVRALDGEPAEAEQMTVLLKVIQPTPKHPPVKIRFGSDGYLYVVFGGQKVASPSSQQAESFLGTIARLDVSDPKKYRIPSDTPHKSEKGAAPEIWARAIGRPWAFFVDPTSRRMLLGRSPNVTTLEIVALEPGSKGAATKPFFTTNIKAEQSFLGGLVYRGKAFSDLVGSLIIAEANSGTILSIPHKKDGPMSPSTLALVSARIQAIGESEDGEIYVATNRGELLAVVPGRP
jgi:glucose/arabinose dehydrogenase